jgi:hypothetical protein
MRHTMKSLRYCCLLILVVAVLGCRSRGVNLPTAPVSGKVTYQSKPLGFGKVLFFHPSGHAASADIAADGSFTLTAYQGKNNVSVECYEADKPGSNKTRERMMADNKCLIPYRYLSYGTSGLTFDVQPGENKKAEFTLTD